MQKDGKGVAVENTLWFQQTHDKLQEEITNSSANTSHRNGYRGSGSESRAGNCSSASSEGASTRSSGEDCSSRLQRGDDTHSNTRRGGGTHHTRHRASSSNASGGTSKKGPDGSKSSSSKTKHLKRNMRF